MKKSFFIAFILLTASIHCQSQSQNSRVFLLRSVGHDLDQYVPYFTYLDQVLLCKIGEGKYSVHDVVPGEHKIHAQYKGKVKSNPETELLVNVEQGKTYYISIHIATKAFGKGRFYCELLSEEEGQKKAKTLLLENKCH